MPVGRRLAKAWFREHRGWWLGTAAALAVVLTLALGVAGTLAGAEQAATQRVADFYTGGLRVTAEGEGAAPSLRLPFTDSAGLESERDALRDAAGAHDVSARLETTGLVSRRSLLETVLSGDDQVGIALPGTASDRDAYGVGILTGVELERAAVRDAYADHLRVGRLPVPADGDGNGSIELLASTWLWGSLLDDAERQRIGDPSADDLALMRLEVTAAHLSGQGASRDVIRFPARIVGLYASGLDPLDQTTFVLDITHARRLAGAAPDGGAANVLVVHGGDPAAAAAHARSRGWSAEGPEPFAERYLGQVVAMLAALVWLTAGLALVLPIALVGIGLSQVLDRSRPELAVARAIGVGPAPLAQGLGFLAGGVLLVAVTVAAVLLVLVHVSSSAWQATFDSPLPQGFLLRPAVLVLVGGTLLAAGAGVWWQAVRRAQAIDLNTALRAPA